MKNITFLLFISLLLNTSSIHSQDQSILIFDPNNVSSSFQSTLIQLTDDSVFIADTLDDNIFNYDALFLFINYPYIISEEESNKLIQYTANGKPAYIYCDLLLQAPFDSASFWYHIGIDEIQGLLIAVQVDSVKGIDTTFTRGVFIDTSFISWSVPVVTGNVDPILTAWWSGSHFNTTFISGYDSLNVVFDLYNLIDDYSFLDRVLQKFGLILLPINVQIQFVPELDTAWIFGGCTGPDLITHNLLSTPVRDSITIEPGPSSAFFYYDSTGNTIPIDKFYFIVTDLFNEYEYELWFQPKSFPPFDPVLIPFDSVFYFQQNSFDIKFVVKQNGIAIDSLSQLFRADWGLSVEDSLNQYLPKDYKLYQNFPNPYNISTYIKYYVPHQISSNNEPVTLIVYDLLGNEVVTLVNERKPEGEYVVPFDGTNQATGIYFYQLKVGNYIETKKMVFLK